MIHVLLYQSSVQERFLGAMKRRVHASAFVRVRWSLTLSTIAEIGMQLRLCLHR